MSLSIGTFNTRPPGSSFRLGSSFRPAPRVHFALAIGLSQFVVQGEAKRNWRCTTRDAGNILKIRVALEDRADSEEDRGWRVDGALRGAGAQPRVAAVRLDAEAGGVRKIVQQAATERRAAFAATPQGGN